eukprot:Plantae.Rhodophyta-Purpureofilum_apyrenoidigerum.ctg19257.p1 GENE.Plantae.Rhodophyta-Purpureofilum_apyrenoidigerum.ctg19257~~Plantae.Rhodophyta-Purpureofilum_apyrenoidigerum.ctg19257.p1  ORF type:complete len:784 (-),score=172.86 Plantae.Rhodophyta-Purpureofilum_apyrenoidigerum.ctg19257:1570-3921(-)
MKKRNMQRLRDRMDVRAFYPLVVLTGVVSGVMCFSILSVSEVFGSGPVLKFTDSNSSTIERTYLEGPIVQGFGGQTKVFSEAEKSQSSLDESVKRAAGKTFDIGNKAELSTEPSGGVAEPRTDEHPPLSTQALTAIPDEPAPEIKPDIPGEIPNVQDTKETAEEIPAYRRPRSTDKLLRDSTDSVPPFKVIVLTMNRPWALERLLKSIDGAEYGNDEVDLDIIVDKPKKKDEADPSTLQTANQFPWKRGEKRVIVFNKNQGLIRTWLTCFNATNANERVVILEDDLEVSPLYYRYLNAVHDQYHDVHDIAGFSLQRATLIPTFNPARKIAHGNHPVYMYKLVGTWGFSPRAEQWTQFQKWFFERFEDKSFKPFVDGLRINDWYNGREWSNWFLRFCDEEDYFTLYGNMPEKTTLCANWREPGEHYGSGAAKGIDFPVFEADVSYDFQLPPPERLLRLAWDGQLDPRYHSLFYRRNMNEINELVEHSQEAEFLAIGLYNSYFSIWARNFLCNLELLNVKPEKLMFVTNDRKAHRSFLDDQLPTTYLKFSGAEEERGTTFSTPGYVELMLNRARLVLELLQRGVTLLLFDPDQVWLEDPMTYVREHLKDEDIDLVGTITTQNELAGNFLFFRPSERSIAMYKQLVQTFESAFEAKNLGDASIGNSKIAISNDQTLITAMALKNQECNVALLERSQFCDGRWYKGAYSDSDASLRPVLINNNFVEGNEEKLHRAKGFGHMFYNTMTGSCEAPLRMRAYYQGKSIPYSWSNVLEKQSSTEILEQANK